MTTATRADLHQDISDAITAHNLAQFTGTAGYTRFHSGLILTDGAAYLVRNGAAWLVDVIGSVRRLPAIAACEREFWKLTVDIAASKGTVICTDGGGDSGDEQELYRQEIDYTDFPLPEISLYAFAEEGFGKIVLLPGEY